jgi:hypothetical protein
MKYTAIDRTYILLAGALILAFAGQPLLAPLHLWLCHGLDFTHAVNSGRHACVNVELPPADARRVIAGGQPEHTDTKLVSVASCCARRPCRQLF